MDIEESADLIVYYLGNPKRLTRFPNAVIHYINEAFAVVHVPESQIGNKTVNTYGYSVLPKLYGLTSEASLAASGVFNIRKIPSLNLRGEGILIGIIDTGIDYRNPVFFNNSGQTKIVSIWDQTIPDGPRPSYTYYGTEYTSDQINQAITADNPLEIVPSTDENGHGTMMAAVAAGNENTEAGFYGVAPDAELVIVKLRQAKEYLRKFFFVSDNVVCFQENYIMGGVQYCSKKAQELNRPIVICLGIGTSQGAHDGRSLLSIFSSVIGDFPGISIVTSAGNEGNMRRHYYGVIDPSTGYNTVQLNVAEEESGFSMELWGSSPGIFSIDITSPNNEYISRIPASLKVHREINFIFDETVIYIDYLTAESETGDQLILLRFQNVASGVWKFNVYGHSDLQIGFHIWLPMGDMISKNTYFIKPDVYTTVLDPGTAEVPISVTAYNPINEGLYINSSRGYTRSNRIKPEIAAPGVDYIAPNNRQEFIKYSGTGVAAAHTAGIVAMLLEWGITRGNQPGLDSVEIKNYLLRGAKRNPTLDYPNRDWGYGILDIYEVFNVLRSDSGR